MTFSRLGGFLRWVEGIFFCFGGVLKVFGVARRMLDGLWCFASDLKASWRRLRCVLVTAWRRPGGVLEAFWGRLGASWKLFSWSSARYRVIVDFLSICSNLKD